MAPTATAATYRYRVDILGTIWWPVGTDASYSTDGTRTFTETIADDATLADALLTGNDGDFESVTDYRVEVETTAACGHREWRTVKDWQSEDTELRFASCAWGDDE